MNEGQCVYAALSKPIPPIVVRIAVAIIFGAAMTIGVSWTLALNVNSASVKRWMWGREYDVATQVIPTPSGFTPTGVYFATVTRSRCWGTDIVEVGVTWADDGRPPYGSPSALVDGAVFAAEMREKFDRGEAPPEVWWRSDGWPLPALSADARWGRADGGNVSIVNGGYLLGPRNVSSDIVRILPLRPVWTGFVIDTMLYASVLLILPTIRPWLRRRRGRCVRCGYKLHSEQERCSECGKPVSKQGGWGHQCRVG